MSALGAAKKKITRRRKVEEAIQGDIGEIRVRREQKDGIIKVIVRCGDVWEFTDLDVVGALYYIEILGRGSWVALKDTNDKEYFVTLEGYDLNMGQVAGAAEETVPWDEFREVLEDAVS